MGIDDALREREPEAEPAGRARAAAIGAEEGLEHAREVLGRDADAVIDDSMTTPSSARTRRARRVARARCTCRRCRAGCRARAAAAPGRRRRMQSGAGTVDAQRAARGAPRGSARPRARGDPRQRRDSRRSGGIPAADASAEIEARGREDVADEPLELVEILGDAGERHARDLGVALGGDPERHADARERRAQLVRDVREQLLLRAEQRGHAIGHLVERARHLAELVVPCEPRARLDVGRRRTRARCRDSVRSGRVNERARSHDDTPTTTRTKTST